MPESVLASLRELLPATSVNLMYGLTEAFRSTFLPPEALDRRPGSMGKAIPRTEILVVNDDGELCGPGEPGELVHRGPTVSMGYWGRPDLTNEILAAQYRPGIEIGRRTSNQAARALTTVDFGDGLGVPYFPGEQALNLEGLGHELAR